MPVVNGLPIWVLNSSRSPMMVFNYFRWRENLADQIIQVVLFYVIGKMKGIAFIKDPDGYWIEIFNNNALAHM